MVEPHTDCSGCPPDDVLARLASGHLDEAAPWLEHIDACAQCRARFEHLVVIDSQLTKPQSSFPPTPFMRALGRALSEVEEEVHRFLRPAELPDELGRLGPYRVLGVLGAGGMGVVLLADEPALNRRVALKVVRPHLASDPRARQRFQREARAMAAIVHDHVVQIYRIDEDAGVPFLAMPLLNGETLGDALTRENRLAPAAATEIGRQIAEGLAAAHARGLVHRDLKPGNVWLEPRRENEVRVRLLDFGLARAITGDSELSSPGGIAGTPGYMSPEQARGQNLDERSDLFSLGIVLYRVVTGVAPFQGENQFVTLHLIATSTPLSAKLLVPEVPARLSELIDRLLEKNPADRPQSAQAVADELTAIAQAPQTPQAAMPSPQVTAQAQRVTTQEPQPVPQKRRWYGFAGLVAVFAFIMAAVPHQTIEYEKAPKNAATPPSLWRFDVRIPANEGLPGRPKELVAVIGSGQRRHWGPIQGLAIGRPGSRVVSDSSGDGIRVWDSHTLQPIRALASRSDLPRPFAVTPNGDRLILTNAEGRLEVWSLAGPEPRRVIEPIQLQQRISHLALDPDGSRLYTADQTLTGVIRCYSLTATELKKPPELLDKYVGATWSLVVSPDGRWVGAAGKSGGVTLWDMQNKNRSHVLKERTDDTRLHCLAFTADSRKCYVVTGGTGSAVYELTGAQPVRKGEFTTHDDQPLGVFVGAGDRLIRVSEQSLEIWDTTHAPPLRLKKPLEISTVRAVAYDPEGRLFTGHDDNGIRVWKVADEGISEIDPLPYSELTRAAISPDGRWLATHYTGLKEKSLLQLFDLTGPKPRAVSLPSLPGELAFGYPAFTPDSSALLALGLGKATLAKWDLATDTPTGPRIVGNPADTVGGSSFRLVPASDASSVISFDLVRSAHRFYQPGEPSVQLVSMPEGLKELVVVDAMSRPDGIVALGKVSDQQYLIQWDRQGQHLKTTPLLKEHPAQKLGVDAAGLFVLGFQDEKLQEQHVGNADKADKPPRTVFAFLKSDGSGKVVAVSADGKWVAAATTGGRLVVADRRSGVVQWEVRLPGAPIELAFTHNGKGLMSANPDGTVFLLTGEGR